MRIYIYRYIHTYIYIYIHIRVGHLRNPLLHSVRTEAAIQGTLPYQGGLGNIARTPIRSLDPKDLQLLDFI